jgi:hypothetical protein
MKRSITSGSGITVLLGCIVCAVSSAQTLAILGNPAHASLPRNDIPGRSLVDILNDAAPSSAPSIEWEVIDEPTSMPPGFTYTSLIQKNTCPADAIVIGSFIVSVSHLSASATGLYTDYDFVVDEVIKRPPSAILKPDIVVTSPSGSVTVGTGSSNLLTFVNQEFPPLKQNTKYLIFLKSIPSTGAYQPVDSFSTLWLNGSKWFFMRKSVASIDLVDRAVSEFEPIIVNWLKSCK